MSSDRAGSTANHTDDRHRPWRRLALALVLIGAVLAVPAGAHADVLSAGGWTTSATAANAVAGGSVTITSEVTSTSDVRALVDVEVYGPDGRKVAQRYWDGEDFDTGKKRTFSWAWTVPATAAAGTYTVKVGVFIPGWGILWHWNDNAGSFEVGASAPPTTQPPAPTTTAATTTTAAPTTTSPAATTTAPPTTAAATTSTTAAPTTTVAGPTTTVHQHDHVHVPCPGERNVTPLGALPPALPMLCDVLAPAVDTSVRGVNTWVDDFDHGAMMAELPTSYVQGTVNTAGVSKHFLHNDHWMTDIRADSGAYPTLLASWMRPAQTFRPTADGNVVIEFEVATPIAGTRDVAAISDSWPEFAISTAPAPTGMNPWLSPFLRNGTYFYEAFAKADVMGCRMQQSRHPICAFYGAGSETAGAPDRLWEINQNGTDVVRGSEYGGDPTVPGLASAWAECTTTDDPDTVCRNTFRVTITPSRIRMDVKRPGGEFVRYYEAVPCNDRDGCRTGQMNRIINNPGGFYVYFAGFAYRIANNEVLRFHWDRIAINP